MAHALQSPCLLRHQCFVHGGKSSLPSLKLRQNGVRGICHQQPFQRGQVVVRAEESGEDFEAGIKRLRESKGKAAYGESRKEGAEDKSKPGEPASQKYDFSDEKLHFESAPHRGDLATNIALGATLLWLPLTVAAVGRAIFIKYRFTDKRLSVITSAPWKTEQLDAAYQEVKDVVTVGRGVGIWGDMVVTLQNNDKIELRSLPQFMELKKYILERRDALKGQAVGAVSPGQKSSSKGFRG